MPLIDEVTLDNLDPLDRGPNTGGGGGGGGDTTPPSAPTITGAVIVAATVTITLNLSPGTDIDNAQSTLLYNIYRDGVQIASGFPETDATWSETQPADGSSHTYGASMSDPAGNEGPVYTLVGNVVWNASSAGSGGTGLHPRYTVTWDSDTDFVFGQNGPFRVLISREDGGLLNPPTTKSFTFTNPDGSTNTITPDVETSGAQLTQILSCDYPLPTDGLYRVKVLAQFGTEWAGDSFTFICDN